MSRSINVALIGNPNTGKTSLFNRLTGLNQKVGNYPGITVEKKEGLCKLDRGLKAHILDLPGTYSLNTSSLDESVVVETLLNKNSKDFPDVAVVISDIENLKRNLLLFTQIKDLEIPAILVINMADRMQRKAITLDIELMEKELNTRVVLVSARKNQGINALKEAISQYKTLKTEPCVNSSVIDPEYFSRLSKVYPNQQLYKLWLVITQDVNFGKVDRGRDYEKLKSSNFSVKSEEDLKKLQHKETVVRYQFINGLLKKVLHVDTVHAKDLRSKLDRILLHKVWGYLIFFFVLLLIFQAIYDWSEYPMDWIDQAFASLSQITAESLPDGPFTSLIAEGIIPGLGGIVIFIPQIAFLFLFIALLEESGYMSRVVFLMDHIMKKFGLSGKSVVPLISGTACAIPAVMATRNIEDWKERLITILVVPFTTCSARLPVYLIIIALVIPDQDIWWFFDLKALTLMLLYLLGFAAAIVSAWVLNKILPIKRKSFFVMEMPAYKLPMFKNVLITVIEKTKSFVLGAGKIIMAISIVLWILASYGVGDKFNNAESIVKEQYAGQDVEDKIIEQKIASHKLEHSFIGYIGKAIEPAVRPLGYDWKIGIAIVSSFAAREVFVGTLATIYSVENIKDEDKMNETIKNRMRAEVNPILGGPLFTFASGISLILFYAFAMQCMSTLAIVKRETNSWKWPAIQFTAMTIIAYFAALGAFQILK
ncbi:ferrous iron transport protein B [Nonlabens antarcticus]|uniref:ferrous iron transport protein B n=1 Tax=Nonlabens antarcticus TaxID=392714 RepID=UPI0018911068|nr:ferrous iron transport protein B [Nonlabens antarcticus]